MKTYLVMAVIALAVLAVASRIPAVRKIVMGA